MFKVNEVLKSKPIKNFLITGILAYTIWFFLYLFFLKPFLKIDVQIIYNLVYLSSTVLGTLGFDVYSSISDPFFQMIGIDGSHPVWIGIPCNGLSVIVLFSIFILSFPGKFIHKIWFIPSGIIILHLCNVLRVCGLAIINFYAPQYLDFNHNYTFTFLVYGLLFLLWIIWVNHFAKKYD